MLFNNGQGGGASKGADGWPVLESQAALGGLKIQSIEQLELLYPLFIEMHEIESDSMGFGEWLGGAGNRLSVQPTSGEMLAITFGDACANPPHGALGGTPGIGGGQYVENRANGHRRFVSAAGQVKVGPDEAWVGVATGGGGFGNPLDRDPEQVRGDVRDGVITHATARDVFGVVLSDGFDPQVNRAATESRREELRVNPRPVVEPMTPGASRWLEENMRETDEYLLNPQES
jgi:N-methylhydantoinase B